MEMINRDSMAALGCIMKNSMMLTETTGHDRRDEDENNV
jgi:hypothetical protein